MRYVTDLVPFPDPNHVAEVVGDDAQVITMIPDVGRQKPAVPPAENHLLAAVRCLPIHFHVQLVRLHQPWRLGQAFSYLSQEEHKPVGAGAVAGERRISLHGKPPVDCPADQGKRPGRIPVLRSQR